MPQRERRILAELASLPADAVRAELEVVQAEKAKLELQEQVLAQMLKLKEWEANGTVGAAEIVQALQDQAPTQKKTNLSASILALVEQSAQPLLPTDVREQLAAKGLDPDTNAIRVALRRWVDRGRLEKVGRRYKKKGVPAETGTP